MTNREQAIRDVAAALGRSPGRLSYAVKNGGLGAKAKELVYAVSRQERVLELEARLRCIVKRFDNADDGTLRVRDGVAWAMAADARAALEAQLRQKEGERG